MKENVLSKRYARALFELARERGILANIHQEIELFNENLRSSPDLRLLLSSQAISKKDKISTIEKLLQDRVSTVFFNFILLLLNKNREVLFPTIAMQFKIFYDKFNKIIHAETITAVPLDSKLTSDLKKILDNAYSGDVQINNRTDAAILGGIIVNVDGQVYDGSLQSQLARLKFQLTEKSNSHEQL